MMKKSLLREVRTILQYHQENGIGQYPSSPAIQDFLNVKPVTRSSSPKMKSDGMKKGGLQEETKIVSPPRKSTSFRQVFFRD